MLRIINTGRGEYLLERRIGKAALKVGKRDYYVWRIVRMGMRRNRLRKYI